MQHRRQRLLLLGALAAVLVLLLAAPSATQAASDLRHAGTTADPFGPLVAAVAVLAWLLAGWLLVVGLVTTAGRLPGLAGRVATTAAVRAAPRAVRRAVEVALGLTVAVGILGALPASATSDPPPAPSALDWPTTPAPAAAPSARTPAAAPDGPDQTVVRPGDTLWGIAAEHLPADATDAQVAEGWPGWWAANRDAIGADPDLIVPGTGLEPPADTTPTRTPTP